MKSESGNVRIGRRAFLEGSTLALAAASASSSAAFARQAEATLAFGLITDLHYADKPPAGSRHYRETPAKLAEAIDQLSGRPPQFVVELGDLIDAADSVPTELRYLKTINRDFSQICRERHYVLGNHCVDTLHKQEFLEAVEQPQSFYAFDRGPLHLIVLDSCFRSDGQPYGRKNFQWTDANVPADELEWLQADLEANTKPVIVFAHQRLDEAGVHAVRNNAAVRSVLASSGNVLAVFQGHSHQNAYQEIDGIHFCTMVAMVEGSGAENNGFSLVTVDPQGNLRVEGFRKQRTYHWPS